MNFNNYIRHSLLKIYFKKIRLMNICENLSYLRLVIKSKSNQLNITYPYQSVIQNNNNDYNNNIANKNTMNSQIYAPEELTLILNKLNLKLKKHCFYLEDTLEYDPVELFKIRSSDHITLIKTHILNTISFFEILKSVRLMNEIIEDDVNNLLREMINKEVPLNSSSSSQMPSSNTEKSKEKDQVDNSIDNKNTKNNSFSLESGNFKQRLLELRDDYKSIIPNEVIEEERSINNSSSDLSSEENSNNENKSISIENTINYFKSFNFISLQQKRNIVFSVFNKLF